MQQLKMNNLSSNRKCKLKMLRHIALFRITKLPKNSYDPVLVIMWENVQLHADGGTANWYTTIREQCGDINI